MTERPEWLSLDPDEELVWTGAPRLRRILPTVGRSVVWAAVFVAVAVVGPRFAPEAIPPVVLRVGGVVLAVGALAQIGVAYVRTRNVDYVLTTRNVYLKRGVLSTSITRVGLENVQNTRLRKGLLGNLFDWGTVAISSAGTPGPDLLVTDLDDPETFRRELLAVRPEADSASDRTRLDPERLDALLTEARTMRRSAERLAGAIAR